MPSMADREGQARWSPAKGSVGQLVEKEIPPTYQRVTHLTKVEGVSLEIIDAGCVLHSSARAFLCLDR